MESDYMGDDDAKEELSKMINRYESFTKIMLEHDFDDEEKERLQEIKEGLDCLHCILSDWVSQTKEEDIQLSAKR